MTRKLSYYEILDINPKASTKDVKTAYRNMAKKYHPDRMASDTAIEKFQLIRQAYDTLRILEKRARYDHYLWRKKMGQNVSENDNIPDTKPFPWDAIKDVGWFNLRRVLTPALKDKRNGK